MACFHVFCDVATTGGAECFDGKDLAFLHARGFSSLDDRHGLARVNPKVADRVAIQVANCFHWVRLAVEFDLVRFHRFLNSLANVTKAHINASRLDASFCGLLDRFQELVVLRVERLSPSAVDDAAVDMGAKVKFDDVVDTENGFVALVWRPVSSTVVNGATRGKRKAPLGVVPTAGLVDESPRRCLELFNQVDHQHSRLHEFLHVLANLSVRFGSFPKIKKLFVVDEVGFCSQFLASDLLTVAVVFHDFSHRKVHVGMQLANGHRRWVCLGRAGLFLLLFLLLFLCSFCFAAFTLGGCDFPGGCVVPSWFAGIFAVPSCCLVTGTCGLFLLFLLFLLLCGAFALALGSVGNGYRFPIRSWGLGLLLFFFGVLNRRVSLVLCRHVSRSLLCVWPCATTQQVMTHVSCRAELNTGYGILVSSPGCLPCRRKSTVCPFCPLHHNHLPTSTAITKPTPTSSTPILAILFSDGVPASLTSIHPRNFLFKVKLQLIACSYLDRRGRLCQCV
eukprot:m.478437 g.478437  ORF g.478437 m.478437 type:complete len:506 (-) comp21144_c0_seq1:1661-3178(-)